MHHISRSLATVCSGRAVWGGLAGHGPRLAVSSSPAKGQLGAISSNLLQLGDGETIRLEGKQAGLPGAPSQTQRPQPQNTACRGLSLPRPSVSWFLKWVCRTKGSLGSFPALHVQAPGVPLSLHPKVPTGQSLCLQTPASSKQLKNQ